MDSSGPITISRFVAFILTPFIVALSTLLANAAQSIAGVDLDSTQLAVYLSSVAVPVGIACVAWIVSRGRYEIAKLNAESGSTNPPVGR